MTLTQLEYVLAVYQHRHFGRAAHACHITQPSLSMQMQKLEEELGLIIFDRSKNPILPTQEGEDLIKQAQKVISESKKIYDILNEGKKNLNGVFRLAVIPTISPYLIPLFACKFSEKHPGVNLIIEEFTTDEITQLLLNDKIDAGILATPLHNDQLIERVLYYEPFYLFVSSGHPFSKKTKIGQDDLDLSDIWLLNKGNCFRDQIINICDGKEKYEKSEKHYRNSGTKDILPHGNLSFESGSFETLKNMVIQCSGYTILPWMAVEQLSSAQKSAHVRPFVKPSPTREVSLVYARTFLKERIINALEDEIVKVIPQGIKSLKNKEFSVIEFEYGE